MDILSIIGLGYAGLHTAIACAKKKKVIGFDINPVRIKELSDFQDRYHVFSKEELEESGIIYTTDATTLSLANFHIVMVPTPVNLSKEPNLTALKEASALLGKHIKRNDVVVYESTVYPGVTESVCIPILEETSGLKCGVDFYAGYSPERINIGDNTYTFYNITKIVSGYNEASLMRIKKEYQSLVDAGVFCTSNIKTAEAVKVIENTQRDVNIAFINEVAQILQLLNLDTQEVLRAAKTKWNFLDFKPGFVGGHCIAVDPYYLIYSAEKLSYYPNLLIEARRINDGMGRMVARELIKLMLKAQTNIIGATIAILGISYKENISDVRNSQVVSMMDELTLYQIQVKIYDPVANKKDVQKEFNIRLSEWEDIHNVSGMVIAVAHDQFKTITKQQYLEKLTDKGILVDVKGITNPNEFKSSKIKVWRL